MTSCARDFLRIYYDIFSLFSIFVFTRICAKKLPIFLASSLSGTTFSSCIEHFLKTVDLFLLYVHTDKQKTLIIVAVFFIINIQTRTKKTVNLLI